VHQKNSLSIRITAAVELSMEAAVVSVVAPTLIAPLNVVMLFSLYLANARSPAVAPLQ
jgi:hypothetical protein